MHALRVLPFLTAPLLLTVATATAQVPGVAVAIDRHAVLTKQGTLVFQVRIACGPVAGFEEFQEAIAGGGQARTGAEAEGGISGTVVCDGVERAHTAHLSPFTDEVFRHGPAGVGVSFFICMIEGDEQACYHGAASRAVVLRGGPIRFR